MMICKYGVLPLALFVLTGCGESSRVTGGSNISQRFVIADHTFSGETFRQWKLPAKLREISGLTLTNDQRLFAHGDEKAVLYELDYEDGVIIKSFSLGNPAVRGDFEGIAYVEDRFYLVTSTGRIYVAAEGADRSHVEYRSFETDIGDRCEIEGLAFDPDTRNLLLACKVVHDKSSQGQIMIQRWPIDPERADIPPPISVELAQVLAKTGGKQFNPSGVEWVGPDRLLLVAARQRSVLEVDFAGRVIAAFKLPLADFHPQVEGIAFDIDGQLILADEGGNKRARLGVYRPAG
ncbi:MAG: SdiA-regulated domain-containing protein [Gammaproteobacteria bacterium]|nr:SdiA-regulated domain-containing protein [Gammaproteobacteria bacterium]